MTCKLDEFLPSMETIQGVKRQLVNAGIAPEDIPPDWLSATIAAMSKWISTTQDGAVFVVDRLLHFDVYRGDDEKSYTMVDTATGKSEELESDDLYLFYGAVARGRPIPLTSLRISEKDRDQCDGCGTMSHCLKSVRDPFSDRLQNLCNFCVSNHESLRVSDLGGRDICERCTVTKCTHHPRSERVRGYG